VGQGITLDSKIKMIYSQLWIEVVAYTGLLFDGVKNTVFTGFVRFASSRNLWPASFEVLSSGL